MGHLNSAAKERIEAICDSRADERTPLIMILSDIQSEFGYVPLEAQEVVSAKTGISVAEIYGVVTFYSFFTLEPKGKYVIGCCLGTACFVLGAQKVIDQFSQILGIGPGETTEDGVFTLNNVACLGCCALAPVMMIHSDRGDETYGNLTKTKVTEILDQVRAMTAGGGAK